MIRKIVFRKVSGIPIFSDDFSLVSRSVSNAGAGLFLFVEDAAKHQVMGTFEQGGAVFPKSRIGERKRFGLVEVFNGQHREIELPPLDMTFPLVDVFPDGRLLLAASRSEWRGADDNDKNGVILDPETGAHSRILLGDGIASMSVDSVGRIWVSYFDEGIFGNFGWGGPGPAPVGASGLNCFGARGDILWSFPSDDKFDDISDCYAMNIQGESASVYFYTEFPLCRVSNEFERHYWKTELSGCHHFAINDSLVLFSGQYDEAPNVGHLAALGDDKIQDVQEVEFVLPDESPISSGQLVGRGADLHYFDDVGWYRTRLVDIDM